MSPERWNDWGARWGFHPPPPPAGLMLSEWSFRKHHQQERRNDYLTERDNMIQENYKNKILNNLKSFLHSLPLPPPLHLGCCSVSCWQTESVSAWICCSLRYEGNFAAVVRVTGFPQVSEAVGAGVRSLRGSGSRRGSRVRRVGAGNLRVEAQDDADGMRQILRTINGSSVHLNSVTPGSLRKVTPVIWIPLASGGLSARRHGLHQWMDSAQVSSCDLSVFLQSCQNSWRSLWWPLTLLWCLSLVSSCDQNLHSGHMIATKHDNWASSDDDHDMWMKARKRKAGQTVVNDPSDTFDRTDTHVLRLVERTLQLFICRQMPSAFWRISSMSSFIESSLMCCNK